VTPLLFDASALISLFQANPRVYRLWLLAEKRGVPVLIPATAIAEANARLKATDEAWQAILEGERVVVLELTAATALGASRYRNGLAVAHAAYEAAATGASIVTASPFAYPNELDTIGF
jgi:hypothetical protein